MKRKFLLVLVVTIALLGMTPAYAQGDPNNGEGLARSFFFFVQINGTPGVGSAVMIEYPLGSYVRYGKTVDGNGEAKFFSLREDPFPGHPVFSGDPAFFRYWVFDQFESPSPPMQEGVRPVNVDGSPWYPIIIPWEDPDPIDPVNRFFLPVVVGA